MHVGRQTDDPKPQTVKLRLNDDMRKYLETRAKARGISISEYLRQLITTDMRK